MFKKKPSIENDYIRYNSEELITEHKNETSLLSTIIRLLMILILLGILVIGSVFGYRFLQNETPLKLEEKKPAPSMTPSVEVAKEKEMYTQDEMQAIMKMMMQKLQKQEEALSTETTSSPTSQINEAEKSLVASLENMEADYMEELNLASEISDTQSTREITNSSSDEPNDNYNKVLLKKSTDAYDRVDELSLEIGKIVQDMEKNKSMRKSTYTQSITKEVSVRRNAMRIIIVKKGDTLSMIAKRAYGSAMAYDKIYNANPDLIKNPNHIYVGQRLRIPLTENQ